MADFYCDHGRYTYAATPTWGTAQEGDGTATGVATPATVGIDLSGATAAAGNTITIMGAVLTCVTSGAGNDQFNAGTGTTLIDNIVTAINRTTNTVRLTAQAAGWGTPLLQNAVFARRTGNNLEIMTRAGSATYNGKTVAQSGMTGVTGPWTFSGGAGGAWGWWFTDNDQATIWPSGVTKFNYGCSQSSTDGRPLAGVLPTPSDVVHLRANNQVLKTASYSNQSGTTFLSPTNYLVDNGTVWSGDTGTLKVTHNANANYPFRLRQANATGGLTIGARALGKLIFEHTGTVASTYGGLLVSSGVDSTVQPTNSPVLVHRALFSASAGGWTGIFILGRSSTTRVLDCKWVVGGGSFYQPFGSQSGNYSENKVVFDGCEFDFSTYGSAAPALFGIPYYGWTGTGYLLAVRNCRLICPSAGPVFSNSMGSVTNTKFEASNCEGFNQFSTLCGVLGSDTGGGNREKGNSVLMQNVGPDRAYRLELPQFYIDWFSGQGYPTYGATLPSGLAWSQRIYWSGSESVIAPNDAVVVTTLQKTNALADGARTVTAQLLVDDAIDHLVTNALIEMRVSYIRASDGRTIVETTRLPTAVGSMAVALPTSSASWTLNSYASHVPRKLELTTQHAIKQNTEVEASIVLNGPAPTTFTFVFINPDLELV